MSNRLASETSPYLLQHADNPVDWYPWGEEAFERARAEDKPVFLSVGYSSCHWCHVMAHESFEDPEVALILNRDYIAVKLDREERPDVDEAYMTAVQLTSGRGGWPMSVFLTPDRRPFFAGTYFPKEDVANQPGFISVLLQLSAAWASRRADVEKSATQIANALRETLGAKPPATATTLDNAFLVQATTKVLADFDPDHGGFGSAPKFPPHSGLDLLLALILQESAPAELRQAALSASLFTLRQMAYGGIHDHVGGGFHRYSTDAEWKLPHFEKMLYDNALLLANYSRAAMLAEQVDPKLAELFADVATGIVTWLETEMVAPEGFYYSALDADSEGEEGRYYVWTEAEVRNILGPKADAFLTAYGFAPEGNYLDEATKKTTGFNIPMLLGDPGQNFAEERTALNHARTGRIRPGLDDKALVGWNGLALAALAEAGAIGIAARVAHAILNAEATFGRLPHQIAKGQPSGLAYLEDYASFTDGLLKLGMILLQLEEMGRRVPGTQSGEVYIEHAARLAAEMISLFYDEANGGFFSTQIGHEELFGRTKPVFDQPVPSANSIAIRVLLTLGDEARAYRSLQALAGWIERAPQATEALIVTAFMAITGEPVEEAAAAPVIEVHTPKAIPLAANVEVRLLTPEIPAGSDRKGEGRIRIQVPEGFHLNSPEPPARWLTPTKVEIRPLKATIAYPPAENDRYEGTIEIPFTVDLPIGKKDAEFEIVVQWQACTDTDCQLATEKSFGAVILA